MNEGVIESISYCNRGASRIISAFVVGDRDNEPKTTNESLRSCVDAASDARVVWSSEYSFGEMLSPPRKQLFQSWRTIRGQSNVHRSLRQGRHIVFMENVELTMLEQCECLRSHELEELVDRSLFLQGAGARGHSCTFCILICDAFYGNPCDCGKKRID